MNEIYLCRNCSKAYKTETAPVHCRFCGACTWNIVKEQIQNMTHLYTQPQILYIMRRMALHHAGFNRGRR
jgi:hypothetical protein